MSTAFVAQRQAAQRDPAWPGRLGWLLAAVVLLWPLLVTTDETMYPIVMGIKRMFVGGDAANEWNLIMATAILAMLPPAFVVLLMQRWFVKGLVDTEK